MSSNNGCVCVCASVSSVLDLRGECRMSQPEEVLCYVLAQTLQVLYTNGCRVGRILIDELEGQEEWPKRLLFLRLRRLELLQQRRPCQLVARGASTSTACNRATRLLATACHGVRFWSPPPDTLRTQSTNTLCTPARLVDCKHTEEASVLATVLLCVVVLCMC